VSSYLVLARKYRPKQFTDIVGQQSVVRTLVNAIKLKRTHQAYVFSGSRGIGKTSIARIFSKALRCPNVKEDANGILISCDQCSDCKEIAAGNSVNVLEIDGASNNGVESVREIRENVKFLPTSGLYKIYIIDEVHMLTTAAFNALLKTLEEPPEHVVFIFATTESHKIPETILGRCQRFDFKRVTVSQISERVKEVLASEKIQYEEAAINLIARAAEGSMRDALSISDQVISFSGLKVTAAAVKESIGLIGNELVFTLLKNVLDRNTKDALTIAQNAFNQGVDLKMFLKSLIEMLHALILIQVGVEKPETHFSDDELNQIKTLTTIRALEENELIFQVYHHGLDLLSRAAQPKLIMDLLLVKTALAETIVALHDGEAVHASTANSAPRRSPRLGEPEVVQSRGAVTPPQAANILAHAAELALHPHGADLDPFPSGKAQVATPSSVTATPLFSAPKNAESAHSTLQTSATANVAPVVPPVSATPASTSAVKPVVGFSFPQNGSGPNAPKESSPPSLSKTSVATYSGPKTWEKFIEMSFEKLPMLSVILESAVEWTLPKSADEKVRLGFREKDRMKVDQLNLKSFREQFMNYAESFFGFKAFPEPYLTTSTAESVVEKSERERKENTDQKLRAIFDNVVVQEAKSLFGAELTQIEWTEKS
jgi:DNA polymerase-3 subunit gamma/tau